MPWLRIGAGAAATGLLLGLILIIKGWHDDSRKLSTVQKDFEVYRTQVETDQRVRKEVSDGFQSEIAGLRANQRQPAPAVRLCVNPPVPETRPSGGDHGPGPGDGQLPEGAGASPVQGRDIGQDLFAIADRADLLAAQLRACQSFVQKLQ